MLCPLSILLIGALITSSCGCIKETKEEKEKMKTLPAGWKWYENETFGIRMGYPEKWEVGPHPYNPNNLYSLNVIEFKYFTSACPTEKLNVVFSLGCKEVKKDFDLKAYLKEGRHWPPDEMKNVRIDGIPGKQLKTEMGVDTLVETIYQTDVKTYVVSNEKLFKFFFVEDVIGKTGYQILDSVEFF
jgi:hypothetical protein